MDCDFSKYKILAAPMLYMIRPGVAERINEFVKNGGTLVTTYWTGIVDENDLCFLGGFPGPLRDVTGIWAEEIDSLYDNESNHIVFTDNSIENLQGNYKVKDYCELIHTETADILAVYESDFYKDMPAVTVNKYGKGKAYHIAARTGEDFNNSFYSKIIEDLEIKSVIDGQIPKGVTVKMRHNENNIYIFVMNFTDEEKTVDLGDEEYLDMISGEKVEKEIVLEKYKVKILKQ